MNTSFENFDLDGCTWWEDVLDIVPAHEVVNLDVFHEFDQEQLDWLAKWAFGCRIIQKLNFGGTPYIPNATFPLTFLFGMRTLTELHLHHGNWDPQDFVDFGSLATQLKTVSICGNPRLHGQHLVQFSVLRRFSLCTLEALDIQPLHARTGHVILAFARRLTYLNVSHRGTIRSWRKLVEMYPRCTIVPAALPKIELGF